jgi:hypothetical protein
MVMEALETRRHRSVPPGVTSPIAGAESADMCGSSISSIVNHETIARINPDPAYTPAPKMAAAALASPTSIYSSNSSPPFYAPGWPAPSASVVSGLISPPESRRTSDNKTEAPPPIQPISQQPQRQSLPSLQEALSNGGKSNPYSSPVSGPPHLSQHYSHSQAQSIPRTYPPEQTSYQQQPAPPQTRLSSPPHPVHPPPTSFARPDPIPVSFAETSRHNSISSLHTTPNSAPSQYAPRFEPLRHEPDLRAPPAGGYTHHPSPPQSSSYAFGSGTQAPLRHPQAYEEQPYASLQGREDAERWKGATEDAPAFRVGLKRHLDVWDFENNLAQVDLAYNRFGGLLTCHSRLIILVVLCMTGLDITTRLHRNSQGRLE